MSLFLQSLFHYPIKSTKGIEVEQAKVYPYGIEQDRRWLLVDDQYQMITQRKLPAIGALQAVPHAEKPYQLTLHYANETVFAEANAELATVNIWADQTPAWQVADHVNKTISDWFEQPMKLVYFAPQDSKRIVDIKYAGEGFQTAFSDGYPILVITQASLDELSKQWGDLVDVRRFRPNLVIAGDCEPFAEDQWQSIQIGELIFDLVKPCSRCVIPSLNPDTQQPTDNFARFLANARRKADGKVYLGQNAVVQQAQFKALQEIIGLLHVGQHVQVLK
jgi:uncharacterized protein YcbX